MKQNSFTISPIRVGSFVDGCCGCLCIDGGDAVNRPENCWVKVLLRCCISCRLAGVRFAGGKSPGISAALTAALSFDYLFIPPYGTFNIGSLEGWLLLFLFIAAAILVVGRIQSILSEKQNRERKATFLYEMVAAIANQQTREGIAGAHCQPDPAKISGRIRPGSPERYGNNAASNRMRSRLPRSKTTKKTRPGAPHRFRPGADW